MKKIAAAITLLLVITNIAGAQNVGIGTSTPRMKLHVSNGDSAVAVFENTQQLNLNVSNALYFKTGSGSYPYTGAIKTIGEGLSAARFGIFTYASTSPNQMLERLSINDVGNVGIGIIAPLAKLHVVASANNIALEVDGGIKVSGSRKMAFVHTVASDNIFSANGTVVSNPICDDDPNCLLFVTQKLNPMGVIYNNSSVGVYYNTVRAKWEIFNESNNSIPVGAQFNILVIKQ